MLLTQSSGGTRIFWRLRNCREDLWSTRKESTWNWKLNISKFFINLCYWRVKVPLYFKGVLSPLLSGTRFLVPIFLTSSRMLHRTPAVIMQRNMGLLWCPFGSPDLCKGRSFTFPRWHGATESFLTEMPGSFLTLMHFPLCQVNISPNIHSLNILIFHCISHLVLCFYNQLSFLFIIIYSP